MFSCQQELLSCHNYPNVGLIETHVFGIVLWGHNLVSRHKILVVFISYVSGVVSLSFTISAIDMCLLYPFVSLVLFFSPCGNDKS